MNNVKAPMTKSYDESLFQALRDPQQAAAYLQAALEESAAEPALLQAVLLDIAIARRSDDQDVPSFVSQPMYEAIPNLMTWLETLGLQLSVTPMNQGEPRTIAQPLNPIASKAA